MNPINDEVVASLVSSFESTGEWATLPARKVGDQYQIAAGHHRIAAMAALGLDEVSLSVAKYTDAEMIRIMAVENSTKGATAGSSVDTIRAVTKHLTYLALSGRDEELEGELCVSQEVLTDTKERDRIGPCIRAWITKGTGIGEKVIFTYLNKRPYQKDGSVDVDVQGAAAVGMHAIREGLVSFKSGTGALDVIRELA
ncbi:MAG: ParB-like nuclease domain-containing protein [Hyphomicrobiaceae bacterium]